MEQALATQLKTVLDDASGAAPDWSVLAQILDGLEQVPWTLAMLRSSRIAKLCKDARQLAGLPLDLNARIKALLKAWQKLLGVAPVAPVAPSGSPTPPAPLVSAVPPRVVIPVPVKAVASPIPIHDLHPPPAVPTIDAPRRSHEATQSLDPVSATPSPFTRSRRWDGVDGCYFDSRDWAPWSEGRLDRDTGLVIGPYAVNLEIPVAALARTTTTTTT